MSRWVRIVQALHVAPQVDRRSGRELPEVDEAIGVGGRVSRVVLQLAVGASGLAPLITLAFLVCQHHRFVVHGDFIDARVCDLASGLTAKACFPLFRTLLFTPFTWELILIWFFWLLLVIWISGICTILSKGHGGQQGQGEEISVKHFIVYKIFPKCSRSLIRFSLFFS